MSDDVINVFLINMDVKIPEQITKNIDGSYSIFLNARLSREQHLRSYQHALQHIKNGDFEEDYGDVQQIESIAHNMAPSEKNQPIPADKYIDRIKQLQRRIKRTQRQIREDQERVRFLQEYCDVFAIEESRYLYGKDL